MPPLDYGLRDRVALVTGAASGIGRATAELLAGMGAAGEVAAGSRGFAPTPPRSSPARR